MTPSSNDIHVYDIPGGGGANALGRRQQCQGGPFGFAVAYWTNVKILADRVCEFWFPNNQVFYEYVLDC
jgi:hypothetical protein